MRLNSYRIGIIIILSALPLLAQVDEEQKSFDFGEKLFQEGQYDLALIQYENILADFPYSHKRDQAMYLAGECRFNLGAYPEARKLYLELVAHYSDSPLAGKAQLRLAQCFEKEGKPERAADSYYRMYAYYTASPEAIEALLKAAVLYDQTGHLLKSASLYTTILESEAEAQCKSDAARALILLYRKQGEREKAEAAAQHLLEAPYLESDSRQALLDLAAVHSDGMLWSKAEQDYRRILDAASSGAEAGNEAVLGLSRLLVMTNRSAEAERLLRERIAGERPAAGDRLRLLLGRILFQNGNAAEAFQLLLQAREETSSPDVRNEAALWAGRAALLISEPARALALLSDLVSGDSIAVSIRKQGLLYTAEAAIQAGDFKQARIFLRDFLSRFPQDALAARVELRLARITGENLGWEEEGFLLLRRIISNYPDQEAARAARFTLAKGMARAGRNREAATLFSALDAEAGWSRWGQRAETELQRLNPLNPTETTSLLVRLTVLTQQFAAKPADPRPLLDMAGICQDSLRQYSAAAEYYRRFLPTVTDSLQRAEILYHLGLCTWRLSEAGKEDRGAAGLLFQQACQEAPGSNIAALAEWHSMSMSDSVVTGELADFMHRYPDSPVSSQVRLNFGLGLMKEHLLDSARVELRLIYHEDAAGETAGQALYHDFIISRMLGLGAEADSLARQYLAAYPEGRYHPQVRKALAIAALPEDPAVLEEWLDRYFEALNGDTTAALLGRTLLERGETKKAIPLLCRYLEADSIQALAVQTGLRENWESSRALILEQLARAYRMSGDTHRARWMYFRLLRVGASGQQTGEYYLSLADLARQEENTAEAASFLQEAAERIDSDSLTAQLGGLQLKLGKAEDAEKSYRRAEQLAADPEDKLRHRAMALTSVYRQGTIARADQEAERLPAAYKKMQLWPWVQASLNLEKARALMEGKNFDQAIEILEKLRSESFKDLLPEIELALGKSLLITNQIGEALKILTAMPEKYPDNPILIKVYYNLGDLYYRSNQRSNAIYALRRALRVPGEKTEKKDILKYLIRVLTEQGMYDGALAQVREYIHLYPRDDQILNMKVKIGDLYRSLNDYKRAIEIYRDLKPYADPQTETEIQLAIGQCYDAMGLFTEAVYEYLKVVYLSKPTNQLPWKTTALFAAGQAYEKLGQLSEARSMYEQVIKREGAGSRWGQFATDKIQNLNAETKESERQGNR